MTEAWAPGLGDVARHIPTRTRDTVTPGSDLMLNTFTPATTPTNDQAQAIIDDAVNWVLAEAGPVPALSDPNGPMVQAAARTAAEWRAAADIEVAYPNRDNDIRVFTQLDQRAKDALAALLRAMVETNTGVTDPLPSWMAPDAVTIAPWGDMNI
jgi:hypothetical protein